MANIEPQTVAIIAGGAVLLGIVAMASRTPAATSTSPITPIGSAPPSSGGTTTVNLPVAPLQIHRVVDLGTLTPAQRDDVILVMGQQLQAMGFGAPGAIDASINVFLNANRLPNVNLPPGQRYAWIANKVDEAFRRFRHLPAPVGTAAAHQAQSPADPNGETKASLALGFLLLLAIGGSIAVSAAANR